MKISAVVLAAGSSRRFGGGDKLLANVSGKPLLRLVLEAFDASSISDIIVVTQPDAQKLMEGAGHGRWRFVSNQHAAEGMASSLRQGLSEIDDESAGAMIALADMPFISGALIDELCAAFAICRGAAIVFPESAEGRQGNPVIWPRHFFEELSALDGDQGGKSVLTANRDSWHPMPVSDDAPFRDIDIRDDLPPAD
jgi:molybdenum cofactor cytidylyltransferase